MEELIEVIQGLKQPGCIDYIQLGSAIVSVIASIIAVFVAIRVPKTIAENQNKIALFEKRYELFQFYRKCQSFLYAIKRDKTIEEIRNSCSTIFEIDCKNTNIKGILILLSKFENASYQIHFLFPKIKEEDARKLYLALYYFILQIVKSEVYDINDVEDNKKDFILGENNFFKLIDYFFVGLLLSIVVYYSNKNIGFIIAIHTLGVIFLNKNIVGYNKSLIKNINYLYLGLNLILFITLIISLIFNDLVGYSYLVIPIIGYLYIFIYGFSIQKYYKQINDYVYHLKVEIWEKISNTTLVSKITLSKPENLYLIGDTHIVIEKNKVNLLFDKNDEKIDQLIECLKDNSITHFKMYLGKENIKDYSINSLKDKIFIINNHFQKKYFDYGSVYKNDFEEIDEILDLENIYSKDVFTDTDLLIINVCQSILNNPFYLIFDNVLSRFNDEIINKILKACKIFNITVVILEHKNLDNKYIDNTIDWNEGIE